MTNGKNILFFFLLLSGLFLLLTFIIYADTDTYENRPGEFDIKSAAQGRLIWQKNNCHVCHQLYGLGGFLGPDLTNVSEKGFFYVDAFIKNGVSSMPSFSLSEEETRQLFEFLKSTNASGNAAPATYKIRWDGMITKDYETNQ